MIKGVEKRDGHEQALAVVNRIGRYIVKVNYLKEDGRMTEASRDGHVDVMLYDDIIPQDRIDAEFDYKEINFDGRY